MEPVRLLAVPGLSVKTQPRFVGRYYHVEALTAQAKILEGQRCVADNAATASLRPQLFSYVLVSRDSNPLSLFAGGVVGGLVGSGGPNHLSRLGVECCDAIRERYGGVCGAPPLPYVHITLVSVSGKSGLALLGSLPPSHRRCSQHRND